MLLLCRDLFIKRPDILKKWQEKFRYILIDEFQDINQVQYDVIRMLAAPENNLFVVGDDDQSIYGFRGADSRLMFQFQKELLLEEWQTTRYGLTKKSGHGKKVGRHCMF